MNNLEKMMWVIIVINLEIQQMMEMEAYHTRMNRNTIQVLLKDLKARIYLEEEVILRHKSRQMKGIAKE
jgi:hypothetical protein